MLYQSVFIRMNTTQLWYVILSVLFLDLILLRAFASIS